jgi:CheY-like chemotaxis protein
MEWGRCTEGELVSVGESRNESEGEPGGGSACASKRVLVCDDTEQNRRLIRVNLELDGYKVLEAADGLEAMDILHDLTQPLPDVITVDVLMPHRDGWWTVSTIRADPRLAHIPIVMVTASTQLRDRVHADEVGVDDFVAKPFEPEELLTKIEALAGGRPL